MAWLRKRQAEQFFLPSAPKKIHARSGPMDTGRNPVLKQHLKVVLNKNFVMIAKFYDKIQMNKDLGRQVCLSAD